jgi:hypothetical protein
MRFDGGKRVPAPSSPEDIVMPTTLALASLVRMSPGRLSRRRRRRLRAMLGLLVVWAGLFGWALVSAVAHDRAVARHDVAAATLGPMTSAGTRGGWFADDVSDYDDGGPVPTQEPEVSIDTEGALADWQHVSDGALYVGDR